MANPTPGKWQQSGNIIYSENGVICELSEIRKGTTINHQPIDIGSPDWDEAMANGRIIIAAPELLAALKAIIETCNVRIDDPRCKYFDAARAAIAKAEGGRTVQLT